MEILTIRRIDECSHEVFVVRMYEPAMYRLNTHSLCQNSGQNKKSLAVWRITDGTN
jgi:hypothetical protein